MAGGTFDKLSGKTRPGTYINFESTRQDVVGISERGTVLLPLLNHSYGPGKEFILITGAAPDAHIAKLGYSVYDLNPSMLLIREALKNSLRVLVYIPKEGTKASGSSDNLTGKAMYGGSRGNDLKYSVTVNPVEGFDVTVYLGEDVAFVYESHNTVEELAATPNNYIEFSGTGSLVATAGVNLSGGSDGQYTNADITSFLDASESVPWNTMAFPIMPTGEAGDPVPALLEAVKTKIKYLRDSAGKYRKAVLSGLYADYEGIINVTNGVVLTDGTRVTPDLATAWVAGVDAGASNRKSNTYEKYLGAVGIIGAKNNEEAIAAINKGEFFFSWSEEGDVVVEYDINSLVTFKKPKDETYRKNRVLRVFDTFGESVMLNFPPNKYDNSPVGWDIMDGMGRAILKLFEDAGAVKNVDYDNDFLVNRSESTGDKTFFDCGLEPVDSAEKLFFTVKTR